MFWATLGTADRGPHAAAALQAGVTWRMASAATNKLAEVSNILTPLAERLACFGSPRMRAVHGDLGLIFLYRIWGTAGCAAQASSTSASSPQHGNSSGSAQGGAPRWSAARRPQPRCGARCSG